MSFRSRIVPVVLVCVLGCAEEAPPPEPVRPVRATRVQDASGFEGRWWPGRASAAQEVNLAFEVAGKLIQRANVGDEVQQGDVLARLDPRDYENQLSAARASLDQARAYLGRVEQAVKSGAVSQQDYTDAKARYDVAAAEVRIRSKSLEDATLGAPFDGTVSATFVENYQNVRAKEDVLRFLDASRLELTINIPEGLIGLAQYVRELVVRFDAVPGVEIPAEIHEISNEASLATRTYPVTLIFDPPEGVDIKPGMAGEATARRAELPDDLAPGTFEVPVGAIFTDESEASQQAYVWVIDEGSMSVSRRAIEQLGFGPRGARVKGIQPGEWIATAGVHFLHEGQKVRFLE
jgi:RND family efflux transporter MFP subunit